MGTKITALPQVVTPVGTDELPISQDTGLGSRITYKATLDQLKDYVKTAGGGTGTITSIGITSTDGSIEVFNSPITSSGTISLTISSVGLDKLDDGGATGGEVLTYNAVSKEWEPGLGGSSGIIPNILVGNGGTTYTLTDYTNDTASNYLVFVGGVAQRPTIDFTINGSSIIFGSSIPSGVQILVYAVISIVSLNLDTTPIGTVSWFAASAAPTSYLECSGGVVPISDYLDLYYVIGTKYNTGGEVAGNFRLPDLRGEFIRGWDHGKGIDTDRTFGSNQTGTHITGDNGIATAAQGIGILTQANVDPPDGTNRDIYFLGSASILTTNSADYWGITRPSNVALLPCIKAIKTVTGFTTTLNFIEKPPSPTNGQVLTYNGSTSTWVASAAPTGGNIISGTATTLNTLTTFDFTGIPSWAKRITIMVSEMSTNGAYSPRLQVGTSAGFITTGYRGTKVGIIDVSTAAAYITDGFAFNDNDAIEAMPHNGSGTLTKLSDTIWCYSGVYGLNAHQTRIGLCGGAVTITGTLDRIRFTTSSPTGTFDGGTVNIMWE